MPFVEFLEILVEILTNATMLYNIATMKELEQKAKSEESEIAFLREWLPRVRGEARAYIKGASTALLYIQENQNLPEETDKPGFEIKR